MASLVSGLDNISKKNNMNIGENAHAQHSWTHANFEHDLVQLYFQLVRIPKYDHTKMKSVTSKYLTLVDNAVENNNERQINYCMSLLFQTRDVCGGKGEYALFYNLLKVWEPYFLNPAIKSKFTRALDLCFNTNDTEFDKPYGSWKDVKYILEHWRQVEECATCYMQLNWHKFPLLKYIIQKTVKSFILDQNSENPSLLARWLPREKSAFGWQAAIFAEGLYIHSNNLSNVSLTLTSSQKRGIMRNYRKVLGDLNRKLGTIQINQAGKDWKSIDFAKQGTSLTLQRQKKAFLCDGKNKNASSEPDRISCRSNYLDYIRDCAAGKKQMKSKRLSLGEMVKDAWMHWNDDCVEATAVNVAWKHHDDISAKFSDCVALLDTSASMTWENCPLYDATGIALKIAESSTLGKRVMTFASQPAWVNLENCDNLCSMVDTLKQNFSGTSTNIYAALNLIAAACVEQNLDPTVVENINLVILSDMQINQADPNWNSLDSNIVTLFKESGLKTTHGKPYSPPTIIYWNMRNTDGFPCSTVRENVIMVSGYSIDVLKSVFVNGPEALKTMKPWDALSATLEANRYSWFWEEC